MKRVWVVLTAIALAAVFTGCAATSGGTAKVKCPACGYEFDAPKE